MADPETLAALKRAYADTILNTTKEAAARVMISEKKARRYQQELVTVRDEAIHTLLRLKHMFDSKVKETEMMSLKQQQKVEELEAQLGEAEDIVGELRMELQVLREELKRVTKGQAHSNHDEDSYRNGVVSVVPEVCSSQERSEAIDPVQQSGSVVANGIEKPSLTLINSIKRCSSKDNNDHCHHTLPSILTKRREAEVCAQKIHKVNGSMANGDLSSSVEVGDVNDGVSLHKVPSSKSLETLEMSGCADAGVSTSSVLSDVRDGEEPMVSPELTAPESSQKDLVSPLPLETSPSDQENHKETVICETEAKKGEGESCVKIEVSASPMHEETPVLASNKNRCIKYTFQRKRRKEVLSNPEGDSVLEESINKKQKTGEKDDGYLESLMPSFTNEPSRDSLRVAQLARQLIPEKKGFAAELVNQ